MNHWMGFLQVWIRWLSPPLYMVVARGGCLWIESNDLQFGVGMEQQKLLGEYTYWQCLLGVQCRGVPTAAASIEIEDVDCTSKCKPINSDTCHNIYRCLPFNQPSWLGWEHRCKISVSDSERDSESLPLILSIHWEGLDPGITRKP